MTGRLTRLYRAVRRAFLGGYMGPRQICVVCGEGFWRVCPEHTGRLHDLVCVDCRTAIDGPAGALHERNQLAPWGNQALPGHVALAPGVELLPDEPTRTL